MKLFWFLLPEGLLLMGLFAWMPVIRGASGFFGVRVSQDFYQGEGQKLLFQYRLNLLILTTVYGLVCVFSGAGKLPGNISDNRLLPWAIFLFLLLYMAGMVGLFIVYAGRVRPHRVVADERRLAASLSARTLAEFTSSAFEAVLALLIIAPLAALIHFYPQLPELIPVHYNFKGEPDNWKPLSFSTVFFSPLMAIWIQGALLFAKYSLVKMKMPLPVERTELYRTRKEEMQALLVQLIDWLRLLISLMLGAVSLSVVVTTLPKFQPLRPALTTVLWTVTGILLLATIWYLVRVLRLNTELEEVAGTSYVESRGEDAGWRAGGAIYYNPDDPALFVEKRIGIGSTMNFGHRAAWWFILYLLGGMGGILVLSLRLV